MIDVGRWVFEQAFAQLQIWHQAGFAFEISINVSAHELQQSDFVAFLQTLLQRYPDIEPNRIEIELLETAAFDNFEQTANTLHQCQALGISIAIDDFGTGYASLNYLKQLPVNTLKIDKSFILDLLETSTSLSIVEASIGLAQAFGYSVIAEGVESPEHGKILLQLGCTKAQGYAIAKAMPASSVTEWLKTWEGYSDWQSVQPLDASERTLLYTSIEHRSWINAIKAYLLGKSTVLPTLRSSQCHLGHWLEEDATPKQRQRPEFQQLHQLHDQLHRFAEELLQPNAFSRDEEIQQLDRYRDEILQKLEILLQAC